MNCLAVVPARGGSKGIPRKNIRVLAGKPLIAYSIEQALESKFITRVVVSTDDYEIGSVAREWGAEVVWRPKEISGDDAASESALLHALDHLRRTEAYEPDLVVFLQCTSPLTLVQDIDGTIETLLQEEADSALAVVPFHYFLWRRGRNGEALGINHDRRIRMSRQERDPQYLEAGAVYVMRVQGLKRARHRFFGKTVMYVMPSERRWEIDEPVDLVVAKALVLDLQKQRSLRDFPDPISGIVFDFDGVFTDNKVVVFEDGLEAVICDRGDGMGLSLLKSLNIPIWVLSSEANLVGKRRCEKLEIPCYHDLGLDKASTLSRLLCENGILPEDVIYVGNDINDIPCMEMVGCAVAVADAHPEVLQQASFALENPGGDGAVREFCDLVTRLLRS